MANAILIWVLTIYLVFEAGKRLLHPPDYFEPHIMLVTATFGVAANFLMAIAIYGVVIVKYMLMFPFLTSDQKSSISLSDGAENLNIRSVMVHI